MLCERCKKKDATFYYHENVNGAEKTYSLCRDCADEMEKRGEFRKFGGLTSEFGKFESLFASDPFETMDSLFSGQELFGSLYAPLKTRQLAQQSRAKRCPLCGMTLADFAKDGKAGCPTCYEIFAEELEPTIGRIHGKTVHGGQAPRKFREKKETADRIRTLEAEKKEAIRTENYERAAEIRDELKNLRGNA